MKRAVSAAVIAVAALLVLSACGPGEGPAGTVQGRHHTYWSATKQWTYRLSVRKPNGVVAKFRVQRPVFTACSPGEPYPACAS